MELDTPNLTTEARRTWELFLAERWLMLACVAAGLVAATGYNYSFRPIYEGSAVISVLEMGGAYQASLASPRTEELVQRQMSLLKSPEFTSLVLGSLSEPDATELARGKLSSWLDKVGAEWVRPEETKTLPPAAAAWVLDARLSVVWREPWNWIEIRFRSSDPEGAARVTNLVVDQFILSSERRNQEQAARATGDLERQLAEGRDRLGRQLTGMKSLGAATSGDVESRRQLLQQQATKFTEALVAAETARVGRLADPSEVAKLDDALLSDGNDPRLIAATSRLSELEERERELMGSLGELHPEVATARGQLASARDKVNSLKASIEKSAKSQRRLSRAQETRLRKRLEAVRAELAALDPESVDYALSKKQAEVAKNSLDFLIQRRQAVADTFVQARLIQSAAPSRRPVDPRRGSNYLTAVVMGFFVGVVLVFGKDSLTDTVRLPEDFRKVPNLSCLGTLPLLRNLRPGGLSGALASTEGGFGDSLRAVRTNLIYARSAHRRAKVIVVTSASPQDGKSTVAAGLAILMKEIAPRVLLIDADLRRPTLHLTFLIPNTPGVSELLGAPGPLSLTAKPTHLPGLDLLTAGTPQELSAALVGSEGMGDLLDQAREQYDWVILDSPPALVLSDASVLSTRADGTVVVCSSETTRMREAQAVVNRIEAVGGIVFGAVLNRVNVRRHGYYYRRSYSEYYRTDKSEGKTA